MTEQARSINPGVSVLKSKSRETVGLEQIQRALSPSAALLEYVIADPILTASRSRA